PCSRSITAKQSLVWAVMAQRGFLLGASRCCGCEQRFIVPGANLVENCVLLTTRSISTGKETNMLRLRWLLPLLLGCLLGTAISINASGSAMPAQIGPQAAIGAGFTYQGRLTDGGNPANGVYDLQFILYDAATGGAQVGPIVTSDDVTVTSGLF